MREPTWEGLVVRWFSRTSSFPSWGYLHGRDVLLSLLHLSSGTALTPGDQLCNPLAHQSPLPPISSFQPCWGLELLEGDALFNPHHPFCLEIKNEEKKVNVSSKHVKLFWTPGAKPWLTINYISLQRNVRGQRTAWSNTLQGSWQENSKFGLKWKIFCFAGSWYRANNNRAGAGLKCPWRTGVLQTSLQLLKVTLWVSALLFSVFK